MVQQLDYHLVHQLEIELVRLKVIVLVQYLEPYLEIVKVYQMVIWLVHQLVHV